MLVENNKLPFENVIDVLDQGITIRELEITMRESENKLYVNDKSPFEKDRCSNMQAKHNKRGVSSKSPVEFQ